MTTKYQRGDPIHGWNDCPPIVGLVSAPISSSSSLEHVPARIEALFERPTALPDRERCHYMAKLLKVVGDLGEKDLLFISAVLDRVDEAIEGSDQAKKKQIVADLLNYMISNHGVSAWCTPLRKGIEKLVI